MRPYRASLSAAISETYGGSSAIYFHGATSSLKVVFSKSMSIIILDFRLQIHSLRQKFTKYTHDFISIHICWQSKWAKFSVFSLPAKDYCFFRMPLGRIEISSRSRRGRLAQSHPQRPSAARWKFFGYGIKGGFKLLMQLFGVVSLYTQPPKFSKAFIWRSWLKRAVNRCRSCSLHWG